ncbi:hypothetical protein EYF80_006173 [Liparis tanakae]|uniref:Uncharacterized protein n=1 Tax=Liparis tanakae TaxID=230148 RepID=A0A4Z2IZZ9_9TELE|nr:hypothetical protein EYF80_006173 [Liparis tanakae]
MRCVFLQSIICDSAPRSSKREAAAVRLVSDRSLTSTANFREAFAENSRDALTLRARPVRQLSVTRSERRDGGKAVNQEARESRTEPKRRAPPAAAWDRLPFTFVPAPLPPPLASPPPPQLAPFKREVTDRSVAVFGAELAAVFERLKPLRELLEHPGEGVFNWRSRVSIN